MKPQHLGLILVAVLALAGWYVIANAGAQSESEIGPPSVDEGVNPPAARTGPEVESNPVKQPSTPKSTPKARSKAAGPAPKVRDQGAGVTATGDVVADPNSPGALEDRARSERLSAYDRIAAIERLKQLSARDKFPQNEVANMLVELFQQSATDAPLRAAVIGAMKGVDEPLLVEPLVSCLTNDKNLAVRRNAASSLMSHRAAPEVRKALNQALARETDEVVRERARRALEAPLDGR